jgi:hypothetical protein
VLIRYKKSKAAPQNNKRSATDDDVDDDDGENIVMRQMYVLCVYAFAWGAELKIKRIMECKKKKK